LIPFLTIEKVKPQPMLRNVIILAPQGQQQFALAALLRAHNAALTFTPATTLNEVTAIDPGILRQSRLIAFTSGTIVPRDTLKTLGYGAYNFHPGSSDYPGWAPAHFALYEGAKTFGAVAHLMTEYVDAGPIVGAETFVIPPGTSVKQLEQIAYVRLAYLFWRLSGQLAAQIEPLRTLPIMWATSKSSRRQYESMCDIPLGISQQELERRIRAFDDDFRGIHPTITLHGFQFRAAGPSKPEIDRPNPSQPVLAEYLGVADRDEGKAQTMPRNAVYKIPMPVLKSQFLAKSRRAGH
jgi:methionyl-tRNA formyltransferase